MLYLKPEFTGKEIGQLAVKHIEQLARQNKFKVLVGIICGENIASIKLFEKAGYEKCAHFKEKV